MLQDEQTEWWARSQGEAHHWSLVLGKVGWPHLWETRLHSWAALEGARPSHLISGA